jgi:hypothetical protein
MPFSSEWVEPQLFLDWRGVRVYRCYHDNSFNQGPLDFCFTLCRFCEPGSCCGDCLALDGARVCRAVSDVRDLPGYAERRRHADLDHEHREFLKTAIAARSLTAEGVVNTSLA